MFGCNLQSLMPRFRMKCKKCRKVVPAHRIWFATSKVLCPGCYFQMTAEQVAKFHKRHPATEAEIKAVNIPPPKKKEVFNPTSTPCPCTPISQPDSWSHFSEGLTTHTIMHSTRKELIDAVKRGSMSKARFRIEMKRRENKEYYNSLADVEEIQI